MSKKSNIKKLIAESEKEIETLEKRRERSQSSLLGSYVNQTKPNEADVEYFNVLTELIELERENIRKLTAELNSLD